MSEDLTGDGSLIHADSDTVVERDLSLLLRIVESAHGKTELGIEEAINVASEACFNNESVNPQTRQRILDWLLLKVAPGAPPSDLHGHFQRVFKSETGIQLEFNQVSDETENHENARSEASSSHVNNVMPSLNDRNRHPGEQNGAMSTEQSVIIDDQVRGDLYVNNPPAYFQNAWNKAETHDLGTLKRQSFDLLASELLSRSRRERLAAMERRADYFYERQLAYKVISQWHNVVLEHFDYINRADDHYEKILRKKSHTKVFDTARIQRIQAIDELRLKGSTLYQMALAVRIERWHSYTKQKLKTKYLGRLVDYHRTSRAHQQQLETILLQRITLSEKRILQPVAYKWLQKTDQVHKNTITADQFYEQPLKTNFVNKWRGEIQKIEAGTMMADDLREYFLRNRYIRRILEGAQEKRNRREVLGRWTLSRWRQFMNKSKHQKYDRAYKVARRNHKHRIARRAFRKLQEAFNRIKNLDATADTYLKNQNIFAANTIITKWYTKAMSTSDQQSLADTHANTLALRHTFTHLTTRTAQIKMMTTLSDQYSHLHAKQFASTLLRRLSLKTFDIQRKTQTALAFNSRYSTRQSRTLMRRYFDQLRVAAADKRGEGPLRLPPATPAQQRREDMIRLTSTTPLYTPMGGRRFEAMLRADNNVWLGGRVTSRIVEEVERDEGEGEGDG